MKKRFLFAATLIAALLIVVAGTISLLVRKPWLSSAEAATGCTSVTVTSNVPVAWSMAGPQTDGKFIYSPGSPQPVSATTITKDSSGNPLPRGTFSILLPATTGNGLGSPSVNGTAGASGSIFCHDGEAITFNVSYGVQPKAAPVQVSTQTMSVTFAAGASAPEVLIRYANVLSVGATSLNITIFGRTYTVDAAHSDIVGSAWTPITLSAIGNFVNVWGTLDAQNNGLIHAMRVRDPNPPGAGGGGGGGAGGGGGSGGGGATPGTGGANPAPGTGTGMPYVPQPSGTPLTPDSSKVVLSTTLLNMPGQNFFTNGDVPLNGVAWVEGDYFAVSSYCAGDPGHDDKGLWVFDGSGSLVGKRDVCLDSGETPSPNPSNNHAASVVPAVDSIGTGQFVKVNGPNNSRPPILYQVAGGQVSLTSKAWTTAPSGGAAANGFTTSNVAAIPGYAVVQNGLTDVLYSLPGWTVLQQSVGSFTPIAGVGNYVIGLTSGPGGGGTVAWNLAAYQVSGGSLQMVGSPLKTVGAPLAAAIDSANPTTQIGFLLCTQNAPVGPCHVTVFSVGASGLAQVSDLPLPASAGVTASTGYIGNNLAVSGSYVATVDCGLPALTTPSGAADNSSAATCGLAVWNGATPLSVQRLPLSNAADGTQVAPPIIRGIAISPTGNIVVTNFNGAYLYKISTATAGGGTGAASTPQDQTEKLFGGPGTLQPSQDLFNPNPTVTNINSRTLDTLQQILQSLQDALNGK